MSEQEAAVAEADAPVENTQEAAVHEGGESQHQQVEQEAQQEKRTVPLEALEAERRKRQDAEQERNWYQTQISQWQQHLQAQQSQTQVQPDEDDDEYTKEMKKYVQNTIKNQTKDLMEKTYLEQHPDAVTRIQTELEPILAKKPWLADSIKTAENRYARAMEIIEDYAPKMSNNTGKRIVENAQKPVSPAGGAAKSNTISRLDMMSKMNRKEFSEWRAQMRGKKPNIA